MDFEELQTLDDEALVQRSHEGDKYADELLCVRYKNTVRMIARPYFLMGADREDLVQEGMFGLFKAIRDYEPNHGAQFATFAQKCILRQIITAVKAASRQKHSPLNTYISFYRPLRADDPDRPLIDAMGASTDDPGDALIDKEAADKLNELFEHGLTPLEKQAAELFLAGCSYQEIADRIGRGRKPVDNALQRVKRKLEKQLEEYEK